LFEEQGAMIRQDIMLGIWGIIILHLTVAVSLATMYDEQVKQWNPLWLFPAVIIVIVILMYLEGLTVYWIYRWIKRRRARARR
jgi:uncharacterized BrkB/YihY/UPF0761 family membrane protein